MKKKTRTKKGFPLKYTSKLSNHQCGHGETIRQTLPLENCGLFAYDRLRKKVSPRQRVIREKRIGKTTYQKATSRSPQDAMIPTYLPTRVVSSREGNLRCLGTNGRLPLFCGQRGPWQMVVADARGCRIVSYCLFSAIKGEGRF